ncbi:MAG: hypothetical protein P8Y42_06885 [Exilibacterium sp.]
MSIPVYRFFAATAILFIGTSTHADLIAEHDKQTFYNNYNNSNSHQLDGLYRATPFTSLISIEDEFAANPESEPITFTTAIAADWLGGDYIDNTQTAVENVLNHWMLNSETLTVYNFVLGHTSIMQLERDFSNSIYVWRHRDYIFGALPSEKSHVRQYEHRFTWY